MNWSRSLALSALLPAGGCGIGHADTLKHGYELLQDTEDVLNEGRVQRAAYYVEQAVPIFEQSDDKVGLAEAYRQYGLVALFGGFGADPVIVMLHPDEPVQPTTEQLDLADKYFLKSLSLYEGAGRYFMASNVDFLLARDEIARGVPLQSCAYFDSAIALYDKGKGAQPDADPETSKGFKGTAREGFVGMKKQAGCPTP